MTLCVAVKAPSSKLNPNGLPLQFEPGIVISADTRFKFANVAFTQDDDGRKVQGLADFAIIGFAGDGRLGQVALVDVKRKLESRRIRHPQSVADLTGHLLRAECKRLSNATPSVHNTEILLGVRDDHTEEFLLYRISRQQDFKPVLTHGIVAIGDGANEFEDEFPSSIDMLTAQWAEKPHTLESVFKALEERKGLGIPLESTLENVRQQLEATEPKRKVESQLRELHQRGMPLPCWVTEKLPEAVGILVPLLNTASAVAFTVEQVIEKRKLMSVGGMTQTYLLSTGSAQEMGMKKSSDRLESWDDAAHPGPLNDPKDARPGPAKRN